MKSILVATGNLHKASEIKAFFDAHDLSIAVTTLKDHSNLPHIEENCLTFAGNALKKARTIAPITNSIVLADDSGLCVEGLENRPGVFSARYAGAGFTDAQNNQKLLEEIKANSIANLRAKFVCAMVLYFPDGHFYTSEGELQGEITTNAKGSHGFGYDPLFYLPNLKCTLAQVPEVKKVQFSHRTLALKNLLKITSNFKQLAAR